MPRARRAEFQGGLTVLCMGRSGRGPGSVIGPRLLRWGLSHFLFKAVRCGAVCGALLVCAGSLLRLSEARPRRGEGGRGAVCDKYVYNVHVWWRVN